MEIKEVAICKQNNDFDRYHIKCYLETSNWENYKIPAGLDELKGFDSLYLSEQCKVQQLLFPNHNVKLMRQLRYQLKLSKYHSWLWNN